MFSESRDTQPDMPLVSLLEEYRRKGIKLWADQGKLKFKAPEGALTPELKARLKQNKAALLAFFATHADDKPHEVIPRRQETGPAVLSFAQQRLWFLDQLATDGRDNTGYNIPPVLILKGLLDVSALHETMTLLTTRHESLRTTFGKIDGEPRQIIHPPKPFNIPLIDLRGLGADAEAVGRELAQQVAEIPFDLETGPLFTARLAQTADDCHLLMLCQHHIISDGWSINVMVGELMAGYQALRKGARPKLPPLPLQYADFSVWQRGWLTGDVLTQHLDFWQKTLSGMPALLPLPTDHTRPAVMTNRGATLSFTSECPLQEAVQGLAREHDVTPFMVLQAAFALLLHYYSGQDDIPIGTPIANRNRAEVEPLLGFFVNTLVMRHHFQPDETFADALARLKITALNAYDHQDIPFELVVERLQPERSQAHAPVIQVMFALQNNEQRAIDIPGLHLAPVELARSSTLFDLSLDMYETPEGLRGVLTYNIDLFTPGTISRIAEQYTALLRTLVVDAHRRPTAADLMPPGDQALVALGDPLPRPKPAPLFEALAQRAAREPKKPALVAADDPSDVLDYRFLHQMVETLAVHLVSEGVGPERVVALAMSRTPAALVTWLAVQRAGGAVVCLDGSWPGVRRDQVLADSGAAWIIADQAGVAEIPTLVYGELLARTASKALPTMPDADDHLAYLIYTSGTTGTPKGVCVSRRALAAHVAGMAARFQLTPQDVILQFAGFGFDASLEQWLPGLITGATVVVRGDDPWSVETLGQRLTEHRISVANLPPALWMESLSGLPQLTDLRLMILGGEALPKRGLARWFATQGPRTLLLNAYGPTETVVTATTYQVPVQHDFDRVPIGEPLPNRTAYVLDVSGNMVPTGVPGQLAVGGHLPARGYLGLPTRTAEVFVPDSFSGIPGGRLYLTGDRVRRLADGTLDYLGRVDRQIKLRGFRIEPGEIEAALVSAPQVDRAAVLLRKLPAGDALVAYVTTAQACDDTLSADLQAHLKQMLPPYMVPAAFQVVPTIPLTPGGKIDRHALTTMVDPIEWTETPAFAEPTTETERQLVLIFQEILGVPQVGLHDNFFQLGGHSLLATRVISRIRQDLGRDLLLAELFESPTPEGLAEKVGNRAQSDEPPMQALARQDNGLPVVPPPLSFAQQRLWFLDKLAGDGRDATGYNMPLTLVLEGEVDVAAFSETIRLLLARHESLRTTFREIDGEPRQIIHEAQPYQLPLIDLRQPSIDTQQAAQVMAQQVAHTVFNLAEGPLFTARLARLAIDRHLLMVCQHHIISDGWSIDLMVREIMTIYQALRQGRTPELRPLPLQYPDFAAWQRGWLQGEALTRRLAFWKETLSGAPALLSLPADHPRSPVQSNRGAQVPYRADLALQEGVHRLARDHDVTPFMVLQAAFAMLLHLYSGQDEVVVGTPIANRNRSEVEPMMGFFINTLVLRNRPLESPHFAHFLAQTKTLALDAYAHQDIPFELVVEALQPERSRAHSPLFQVMFALQNNQATAVEEPGLRLAPVPLAHNTTLFDLSLSLMEGPEGLRGQLEYSTDLFEESTMTGMVKGYSALLAAVIADSNRRVTASDLMSQSEKAALLEDQSDPLLQPTPDPLYKALAHMAEARPDAPAMIAADDPADRLDYRTLYEKVEALAMRLVASGIRGETVVALAMNRNTSALVAQLAVWRAGGAVVCLDGSWPVERLRRVLNDSRALFVLAEKATADQVMSLGVPTLLYSDLFARSRTVDLPEVPADHHLSYLIYTSGTTGTPKGVAVSRRALASHCHAVVSRYQLTPDDVILQFAAFGFDASLEQWLPGLSIGACVIARGNDLWGVETMVQRLRAHRITVANLPPGMWMELLTGLPEDLPDLRLMILGGEALPKRGLPKWFNTLGERVQLLNAYGPTETVITATVHDVPQQGNVARVPIGAALANRRTYVLDEHGKLAPIGVPGQLAVGGHLLARGYLRLPARTAEVFVPDPFSRIPGGRLYLTGDRVRRLPDGALDYLGRVDRQVKLRGFRIEPGDIEAALVNAPQVARAAVLLHQLPAGDALVAYVVPAAPHEGELTAALQQRLADKLPPYMIPTAFIEVETIPLTPGGKVDRQALRTMVGTPELTGGAAVAEVQPTTATEARLIAAFREILSVPHVGLHDNFFELGGHSLLATRVISWIRRELGQELLLAEMFETPTPAGLAQKILHRKASEEPPMTPLPRTPEGLPETSPPVSFAQQRLWFLDHLSQAGSALNHAYNMPMVLSLEGLVTPLAMQHALATLISRHESLRTTFAAEGDTAVQIIAPPVSPNPLFIDLSGLSQDACQAAAQELAQRHARTTYNLKTGPLFEAVMVRLAADKHHLMINMHHIISDGWSMGVVARELMTTYNATAAGETVSLPPLPLQYTDFSAWQRGFLSGEILARRLQFWQEFLADAPSLLPLPTDRPRPAFQQFDGAMESVAIGPNLTGKLNALAAAQGCTLYMVLEAAFAVLLSRLSGACDLVIGTPIANRNRAETESLIGFFVNTLALRHDLSGNPKFTNFLAAARQTLLQAYDHQDVPLEQVIDVARPERNPSHTPLFQVMFSLQNLPVESMALPGLDVAPVAVDAVTAKFDLTFALQEVDGTISGAMEYSTALFDAATIDQMLGRYLTLLVHLTDNPETGVADLPLLRDQERTNLLQTWSAGPQPVLPAALLPQAIADQAQQHPEQTALRFREETWTYAAMNNQIDALAHHLRSMGVGPESVVAVLMHRSPEMIFGLLAVHRAGGAYVPLDPTNPPARLQHIIEDAGAMTVLVHEATAHVLPEAPTTRADAPYPAPPQPLQPAALTVDHAAYLLFTSGSTGTPKGVMVHHGALQNMVAWTQSVAHYSSADRVVFKSPLAFDASVWEIFTALGNGAQLIITDPDKELAEQVCFHEASVILAVPTQMRALLDDEGFCSNHQLRLIFSGGEAMTPDLRDRIFGLGNVGLYNLYGPTEICVMSSGHHCDPEETGTPPLGKPLSHTRHYVLDQKGLPTPVGVAGELCVGGISPARGYLGKPALTAQAFVPDPYSQKPGARLYRTGDSVRYLPRPRGEASPLVYMGRIDHQVKLRGFRIELEEIEAVLASHEALSSAVVLVREITPGNPQLIAYAVYAEKPADSNALVQTLKQLATEKLPHYMVPGFFLLLDTLPYKAGGKLDTKALPLPGREATAAADYVAPASELEQTIATVWQEVLGLDKVGSQDNFFDLGGHSMLLIQLHRKLQEALGREDLELVQLIANPTVAAQAQLAMPKAPLVAAKKKTDHGARRRDASKKKKDQWKKRRGKR